MTDDGSHTLPDVLDVMAEAFIALDHEWRIVAMNREAERLNGRPRELVIGRTHWEEWPASIGSEVERQYRRAMSERVPVHFQHRYSEPGGDGDTGHDIWLDIHAYPTAVGIGVYYQDISAQKRAELRTRALLDLSAALNGATTLEEVACLVVERGMRASGAGAGSLALLTRTAEGGGEFEIAYTTGMPEASVEAFRRFPLKRGRPLSDAVLDLAPIFLEGEAEWSARFPDRAREISAIGYTALAAIPVTMRDDVGNPTEARAGLTLLWKQGGQFDPLTRDFLATLGEMCAQAIERTRLAVAERSARNDADQAAARITTTLAGLDDVIAVFDENWCITYLNPAAQTLLARLGHDASRTTGQVVWDAVPEVRDTRFETEAKRAAATKRVVEFEHYFAELSTWFESRMVPGPDGTVTTFSRDVTDRRRATDRAGRMQRLSGALSAAVTQDEVARAAVTEATAALGGDAGIVMLMEDDGSLRAAHSVGMLEPLAEELRVLGPDAPFPIVDAVRSGRPVILGTLAERVRAYGPSSIEWESSVSVPLLVDGRTVGGLAITFRRRRAITEADTEFLLAIGRSCADAVRRASLYATLADTERRAKFLADASGRLGASLDYSETLATVARLAVPDFADYCVVDVLDDEGQLRRLADAHRDEELGKVLHRTAAYYPAAAGENSVHPVRTSLSSDDAVLFESIDDAWIERASASPEHRILLRELAPRTILMTPLVARGERLGVISLVMSMSDRTYGPADIALARELARRAADAIDHARLYAAVQEANRAKTEWVNSLTHELRTPLVATSGLAAILYDEIAGPVTDGQKDMLRRIKLASDHLAGMVEEILTFARIEAGRETLHVAQVDVCEVVREAIAITGPMIEVKGVALRTEAPDAPVMLATDAGKVRQALVNLLSNAAKFTDAGEIVVSIAPDTDGVTLSVRDTGIGISPEFVARIWEPFWQVDQKTTRRAGGTGLGLAVTKRLAELLGGAINVQSRAGRGSTFIIALPNEPPRSVRTTL